MEAKRIISCIFPTRKMYFPFMYRKGRYKYVNVFSLFGRCFSNRSSIPYRTEEIREEFISYFRNRNHKFIRSSPVVPYCDPSVTFVNAGMNQFKSVFLGLNPPPAPCAVNSQKCIRVGGKHNDLEIVGSDGYHHTFFEMLGSWSFGDYFKKEACFLAWEQLTKVFGLDTKKLYVTYFGGDENLGLHPDLETKEIWLQIGVPANHVLPFGAKDNFWEMGPTGPCGPCTEIHFDFLGRNSAVDRVNAGYSDLIELWNLVFIQFVRHDDGSLSTLPCQHVDTGMGLERLASVLQGVTSTYDTDIFLPLFKTIHKNTGAPAYGGKFQDDDSNGIDTGYRILADHARMITVAIADGMLPDHNHRLRRVVRRALTVSHDLFLKKVKGHELIYDLCARVADSLEGAYPGMVRRLECIKAVLIHEEQMLSKLHVCSSNAWSKLIIKWPQLASLDLSSTPGVVQAFRELEILLDEGIKSIDDKMAFGLYDTYGLSEDTIKKIGGVLNLHFDADGLARKLNEAKSKSRKAGDISMNQQVLSPDAVADLLMHKVPSTEDKFKYNYYKDGRGNYQFEPIEARVEAIIYQSRVIRNEPVIIGSMEEFGLILDRTCFYHESGGQIADTGNISPVKGGNFQMTVKDVQEVGGFVVHWGHIKSNTDAKHAPEELPMFQIGDTVSLCINKEQRLKTMRNHTAVHCLGAAIRSRLPATAQRSSLVASAYFSYQFSAYGIPLLETVESGSSKIENSSSVVDVCTTDSSSIPFSWQELMKCVENDVRQVVKSDVAPVVRQTLTGMQLMDEMTKARYRLDEIATVPGEVYPESGVHLIEIKVPAECLNAQLVNQDNLANMRDKAFLTWSREPCCGTHLLDATDIEDFSIIDVYSAGSGSRVIKAVTGEIALKAKSKGKKILLQVKELGNKIEEFLLNTSEEKYNINEDSGFLKSAKFLEEELRVLMKKVKGEGFSNTAWEGNPISYVERCKGLSLLGKMEHSLKEHMRSLCRSSVEGEITTALSQLGINDKFLVHWIRDGGSSSDKVLQKATKCCPTNLPVLVFAEVNGGKSVKARCVVPKELVSKKFNAELWMKPVMEIFKSSGSAPKGQNPHLVFNMRERKITKTSDIARKERFNLALIKAQEFATNALSNYEKSS